MLPPSVTVLDVLLELLEAYQRVTPSMDQVLVNRVLEARQRELRRWKEAA